MSLFGHYSQSYSRSTFRVTIARQKKMHISLFGGTPGLGDQHWIWYWFIVASFIVNPKASGRMSKRDESAIYIVLLWYCFNHVHCQSRFPMYCCLELIIYFIFHYSIEHLIPFERRVFCSYDAVLLFVWSNVIPWRSIQKQSVSIDWTGFFLTEISDPTSSQLTWNSEAIQFWLNTVMGKRHEQSRWHPSPDGAMFWTGKHSKSILQQ